MHNRFPVVFFVDQNDYNPVFEYMFADTNEKDLSVLINVIQRLSRVGQDLIYTNMAKRLDPPLFELRKNRHRIIYGEYKPNCFILLFAFIKQTQKTPQEHIKQAKDNFDEYMTYGKIAFFDFPSEV